MKTKNTLSSILPTSFYGIFSGYEFLKIFFLSLSFACIIACYTIVREIRDVIFLNTVGPEYVQTAQALSVVLLVPLIFLVSFLIDRFKNHQLLIITTLSYGTILVAITYYLGHPTIGILNTNIGYDRVFGWFVFIFSEGFFPFITGIFLAFVHTLILPKDIAKSYPFIVAGSAVGGALSALFSFFFVKSASTGNSDIFKLKFILFAAVVLILIVPVIITFLQRIVPKNFLRGYEDVHKFKRKQKDKLKERWYSGLVSGLILVVKYPYVLGIFLLTFFWESLNIVLSLHRLRYCSVIYNSSLSELTEVLFLQVFWIQLLTLFFSAIFVRLLLTYFSQRVVLIIAPILNFLLFLVYFLSVGRLASMAFYVIIRSFNLAMSMAVKETLYIPTTREVKFKSKSWIDTFGNKFSRSSGGFISMLTKKLAPIYVYFIVVFPILISWIAVANLLGKRFKEVISDKEIVG